jgi:hypothetical protein
VYVARVLRELGVEIRRVAVADTRKHENLRDRLAKALLATLLVDAVGTGLVYWFEHGARHTQITSVWRAFFWVSTQLLTVSSQMQTPMTNGGRIVDIVLEIWAISVVTAVAGAFAAFLQQPKGSASS